MDTYLAPAPSALYKYVSLNTERRLEFVEQIINRSEVFLSSPLDFNDPFDCLPRVDMPKTSVKWNIIVKQWINRLRQEYGDELAHDTASALKRHNIKNTEELLKIAAIETAAETGVYCLTELNDSVLMWSHYADNHRGICLQFNLTKPPISILHMVMPVIYQKDRATVPPISGKRSENVFADSLRVKADFWEYEREWRVLVASGRHKTLKFPENALTGIIFGARCDQQTRTKIQNMTSKRASYVSLYEANISESKFELDLKAI